MKQFILLLVTFFMLSFFLQAQNADSSRLVQDSVALQPISDSATLIDSVSFLVPDTPAVKIKNQLLNTTSKPVSFAVELRNFRNKDIVFYIISGLILLLAFLKFFYSRYFTNLFRVFFNTSLRQSQLTDQLLQAKLPSLLFNLFFVLSGGIYVYFILVHYQLIADEYNVVLMLISVGIMGFIYLAKFCILKFTGWVTGLHAATNTYAFIVFLINKIIGVFLLPFTVILIFSQFSLVKIAALVSLMSVAVFLLLRFFRSYGLLQNQLKISRFHFLLYIMGMEILPLLLIYKGLMGFLSKNM